MGIQILAVSGLPFRTLVIGPNTGFIQSCGEVSIDRVGCRAWPAAWDTCSSTTPVCPLLLRPCGPVSCLTVLRWRCVLQMEKLRPRRRKYVAFQGTCRRQCQLNLACLETCCLEVEHSMSGRWG